MRRARRLFGILGLSLGLAACGPTDSYRYKLTVVLDTPDGVKTGFNVVDEREYCSDFWHGCGFKFHGEAIFIDLGVNKRPLVILLNGGSGLIRRHRYWDRWFGIGPGALIKSFNSLGSQQKLHGLPHVSHEITPDQLPDLITFRDIHDPNSAIAVDPNDLGATLGDGVSWRSVTIELTDEPTTNGLAEKLPWIADKNASNYPVAGITQEYEGKKGWFGRNELIRADF